MKTVVITGASKGIGLATTKKFLDEGWQVIATYLNEPISIEHENLKILKYDQGNPESIAHTVEEIKKLTGHIDVLVNNAGILIDPQDMATDPVKLRKTLEVNVVGVADFTEKLLPLLSEGSKIINLTSGYGSFSVPIDDETSSAYRISKAAVNMYTHHLAFRLRNSGVIVSGVKPGWVKTDMGMSIASESEKPDRSPEQAADDIYNLAITVHETGYIWEYGEKQDW